MTLVRGSQHLLQTAVNHRPELLTNALRKAGALGTRERIEWRSPLSQDDYREYRDEAALSCLGLPPLRSPLRSFWPARGAVWDALAVADGGRPILVEAKAHIPELHSPPSKAASPESQALIAGSLAKAQRFYAPRTKTGWGGQFYQYANRLAYHFWLRSLNKVPASLVFLYFTNAVDMDGPASREEWEGAKRLVHAVLGIPAELEQFGVYSTFVDATLLADAA